MNGQIPTKSTVKSTIYKFLLLTFLCFLLGLIDGYRSHISSVYQINGEVRYGVDLDIALRWDVSGWLSWIFLTPIIVWLCRKFPLDDKNWKEGLLIFIPIGLVFALIRTLFPFLSDGLFFDGFRNIFHWLPKNHLFLITDYSIALIFFGLVLAFGQATNYYKRYREEELLVSQLELQLSKAQLQALKMQLHPHFLFNTLNSISALQLENVELAQEMTARLGDFLRLTLQNIGIQEVSLEREIEFLQCYLDIEKVRFGEKLTTNIEVETQVLDCQVPNLILQPLVENSIKHGIAQSKKGGSINIRGIKEDNWLKVEIEDSGKGINDKDTDELFTAGLGLTNTKERLKQLYGSNFRFELENLENGLRIILCLPNKSGKEVLS